MNKHYIRQNIRNYFRYLRNQQNNIQQIQSSQIIAKKIMNNIHVQLAKKIAIYLPFDGEISTTILISNLLNNKKKIYLPIINKNLKTLLFMQYYATTNTIINKFNIIEPIVNSNLLIPIHLLDVIIVPLVAFDQIGNRVGMGHGYYDRSLSEIIKFKKPYIIGLAHRFQYISINIPVEPWDIKLSTIITT